MRFLKMTLPISLAFIMAMAGLVTVFVPHHFASDFQQETTVWSRIISAITMFIGAYSLSRMHYNRIKRQQKGWGYSVVLFFFFALMVFLGVLNRNTVVTASSESGPTTRADLAPTTQGDLIPTTKSDSEPTTRSDLTPTTQGDLIPTTRSGSGSTSEKVVFLGPFVAKGSQEEVKWLYNSVMVPVSATQFSLLGFFICSAAYRTFRAKTIEATVLLLAALIVMLGQVPIAAMIWPKIPIISGWLVDVPNMAVKRAILFGICAGSVGTSLRVMFGIERSYMGGD